MNDDTLTQNTRTISLVTFKVGELLCALDIVEVDEIKRAFHITKVHRAPDYISGVVNIRGHIVTVINLKKKFKCDDDAMEMHPTMVVVRKDGEQIGLLVDTIEDTIIAKDCDIDRPPSNIKEILRHYLTGVYKTQNSLVAILNRKTVVERDRNEDDNQLTESKRYD
jgi:purine-binding chemotaxis protein CheW